MPSIIIAENILDDSHFLSATEQEGKYWGPPQPASDNAGSFRLLSKGTPADFSYSGTATSDGSTTTIIDSSLMIYGDDFFIGATIEFTGGENTSGTKTAVDFDQATGTLSWSGAVNSTLIGDTFALTIPYATRDIRAELIGSGDVGDATFKWSHDGGTTWLGRDNPWQATWLAEKTIKSGSVTGTSASSRVSVCQDSDGNLLAALMYTDGMMEGYIWVYRSTDGGVTWAQLATVLYDTESISNTPYSIRRLQSGRIMLLGKYSSYYSDDEGVTWSETSLTGNDLVVGEGGVLHLVDSSTSSEYVKYRKSIDGGNTWTEEVAVIGSNACHASIAEAKNGNLVCVFLDDSGSATNWEVKCRISSDGGATWGSSIDIMDYTAFKFSIPMIQRDIDGTLYCISADDTNHHNIHLSKSTDNGATWETYITLHNDAGSNLYVPGLALLDTGEMICTMADGSNAICVRRGMWEAYSSNACPCAINATPQKLVCGAELIWHGGAGIAGDDWSFTPEYYYSAKNLITDSPSQPWRSEQDNIACALVIDLGANVRHRATGVAFFGCNLRTLSYQMNATDSWGSPSVDESVSFDIATGTIDAVSGNYIQDTSLLASYKDHELKGKYFRATSGTDSGETWQILDNVGDYFILDTTAAHNLAASNTFAIFQSKIADTLTGGIYWYLRISIAAQKTAEGYYQIGAAILGTATTLTRQHGTGFSRERKSGVTIQRTPAGGMIPIIDNDPYDGMSLIWRAADNTRREIIALADYLRGRNFVYVPDSTDMTDCLLLKITGPLSQTHRHLDRYDITVPVEEVL